MNALAEHRRWLISWILRLSIALCLGLLLIGIAVFLLRGGERPPANPSGSLFDILAAVLHRGEALHAGAFLVAGLLVLLLTPVARLVAGIYVSARGRDGLYVLIGLVVLGLVIAGLLFGQAGG